MIFLKIDDRCLIYMWMLAHCLGYFYVVYFVNYSNYIKACVNAFTSLTSC